MTINEAIKNFDEAGRKLNDLLRAIDLYGADNPYFIELKNKAWEEYDAAYDALESLETENV